MGRHALLSASSSHRWLACPPSARLCENYEDTGSEYAQQGTDAHSLCEHKLKLSLGMETEDPTEGLEFYDEEMEECACGYVEYVLSLVEEVRQSCKDPVVLIEQRLDFSRYVEEGFGTGDCVIIADGTLYIIDYKHGKGVEVSAEGNPQMMLYALGALELFDGIYDIESVRMAIYQPRRENVSVYAMAKDELLQWAEGELARKNSQEENHMSNNVNNPTKVITGPNTRWSYCNAWEAKAINGGTPKFSVSLIIPKSDTATIKKIKAAIEAAYREGEAKLKGNGRSVPALSVLKTPLRDGDVERPDDEAYADSYFVNANSTTAPGIVDADRQPILDHSEVYSGVYGRASINFYAFNSNGNKGIACGLNNLQKIRDGEPLGGRSRAEDDFVDEAGDEEDFLS